MSSSEYIEAIDNATNWRIARDIGRQVAGDYSLEESVRSDISVYALERAIDLGGPINF